MRIAFVRLSIALLMVIVGMRSANAQTLTLILDNASQTGAPGGNSVVFSGVLTNAGSIDIVLDGSAYNFSPPAPDFDVTDAPTFFTFLVNGGVLAPGDAYSGALFQVDLQASVVPNTIADGTATFTGSYLDNFGGSVSVFAADAFHITAGGSANVPEPGTLALLAAIVPVTLLCLRRRTKGIHLSS